MTAVYLVPLSESVPAATVNDFLAQASGVRRVVLLSARGLDGAADAYQEPVELALRAADVEWTILRPAWFMQNFSEDLFPERMRAGELALPAGEGREPFVHAEDIADVAVAALTEDGHAGEVYELTGPESLSFRTAVELIAEAAGRPIRYTPVEAAPYAAALVAEGWPADVAGVMAEMLGRVRDGLGDRVTGDVRRALGREPRTFAEYVKTTWAA